MNQLVQWRDRLLPAIDMIKRAAGTTEDEFLLIGGRMQDFYARSLESSRLASQLVELVSDDDYHDLASSLRLMIDEMGEYLEASRQQNQESWSSMEQVLGNLETVSQPLDAFHKMDKTLRMLGISTKIESARLGELGNGFTTLAIDVDKLSLMVREKTDSIQAQQNILVRLIEQKLQGGKSSKLQQDAEASAMLSLAKNSFEGLTSLDDRCSRCGDLAGHVSAEVAASISEAVSSMQIHDMMRQQMEHVSEALEQLAGEISPLVDMANNDTLFKTMVSRTGDVCELQVEQVRNATAELRAAVVSIIASLRDIGDRQSRLSTGVISATGTEGDAGSSYIVDLRRVLSRAGGVLRNCAETDLMLLNTLKQVAETISGMTVLVGAIEEISADIDLIALNAQIKAAHTGKHGVALGVLAEAIKVLSLQAIPQADALRQILSGVNDLTVDLVRTAEEKLSVLGKRVAGMEGQVDEIVSSLGRMNETVSRQLGDLVASVDGLNEEIREATENIVVHETVAGFTRQVMTVMEEVVAQARAEVPATSEFNDNLRHMTAHYTMQSERRIHEAIASKRSVKVEESVQSSTVDSGTVDNSEFGENVDLF